MEDNWLARTELLLGSEKTKKLQNKNILVVGLGGVGAYAAEMLVRAGIGRITIIDGDSISLSNINRQLLATHSQLNQKKAKLMAERLKDINPEIQVSPIDRFIKDEYMKDILNENFDYVIDAIDTFSPKIYLIYHSLQKNLKIVSSMGAAGKLDPSKVQLANLEKSYNCKLARILRKKLRYMGIQGGFPVVFSTELVNPNAVIEIKNEQNKKSNVGSISYMPALFGIFCASKVINDLLR